MKTEDYFNTIETPLSIIHDELLDDRKVNLFIKRADLINNEISGNKWYKLKYNLIEAEKRGFKKILTFGGAYSNHIYASAAACASLGFESIGIIRGEEHLPLNPTLRFAQKCGMNLHYISRSSYQNKYDVKILENLKQKFGNFYLIPEGGSNSLAVRGCAEIIQSIKVPFDYVCTPCGTGGTLGGLAVGLNDEKKAIGFSVLKNSSFLAKEVERLILNLNGRIYNNWEINFNYHFGGYAKFNSELINFISEFYNLHKIQLEPIYTGKMMYGIYSLIKNNYFKEGETIIAIHTGGIQGLEGLISRNMIKNKFF